MKIKNKTLIFLLAALLLLGGCSNKTDNKTTEKESASTQVQTAEKDNNKQEEEKVESATEENAEENESEEDTKKDDDEENDEADVSPSAPIKEQEDTTDTTHSDSSASSSPSAPTPAPPAAETTKPTTPPSAVAPEPTTPPKKSVSDVMNTILAGVNTPNYELTPIDASNFSYYMFVDYIDGAKGVSADALISSTAHSVCLIELPDTADAAQTAAKIKQNADPAKWICVEAEKVEVATKDNMVLLVMSDSQTTDSIVSNFNNR